MINEISVQIEQMTDTDGYILLQCSYCDEKFKTHHEDYSNYNSLSIKCPLCGLNSESYLPTDTAELVREKVSNDIQKEFKKLLKKPKRYFTSKNHLIKVQAGNMMDITVENFKKSACTYCDKVVKISSNLQITEGYCPFCGVIKIMTNDKDLKKLLLDFNGISKRLFNADFREYNNVLLKFINYIDNAEIISNRIKSYGAPSEDIEEYIRQVIMHPQIMNFVGDRNQDLADIYYTLNYCVKNEIYIYKTLAIGYSRSNNQDKISKFNQRVVMVLIDDIQKYITKKLIDVEAENMIKPNINISGNSAAVNVASDHSIATQNNVYQYETVNKLIDDVRNSVPIDLGVDDKSEIENNLTGIQGELSNDKPHKKYLEILVNKLKGVGNFVKFNASVLKLSEFIASNVTD